MHEVVIVFFSTSNHNPELCLMSKNRVVIVFFSTSNHNWLRTMAMNVPLLLFFFLHQTTTYKTYSAINQHYIKCFIIDKMEDVASLRCKYIVFS